MTHDVASTRPVIVLCAVLLLLGSSGASQSHATGIPPDAKLTASDGSGVDGLGVSVSLSGDTALVGAPGDDAPEFNSGSAYVFVRSGMTWSEQAKLTASDAAEGDAFGRVSVSGDTALVGAPNDDDAGPNTGSAYVFVRSGTSWSEQAKLTANDMGAQEGFGISVAVSGDTAVVGAHFDDAPAHDSGSAYVFVRSGTTWSQQAKLTASDVSADAYFGNSVAIEGDTILVGANGDDGVATDAGAVYAFVRSGTNWNEQAKLTASDGAGAHQFGRSVAISGETAVVGRPWGGAGAAYVFVRSGSSWSQQAKLAVSDLAYGVRFGWSVALSEDWVVVGVLNDPLDEYTGSAYLFERHGSSWSEEIELTAPDITAGDLFGVAVAAAGNTALVGSQGDDDLGVDAGAAYVFPMEEKPEIPAATTSGLLVLVLLMTIGLLIGRSRSPVS